MTDAFSKITAEELLARCLGPEPTSSALEEPSAADLSAYLADEPLERGARLAAEAHLAEHPALAEALREALAVEAGDAPIPLSRRALRRASGLRRLLIDVPPFALAAAVASPPIPEDRQVLAEQPGRFRLVYFRRDQRARIALFVAAEARPRPRLLSCLLDTVALPMAVETEGQQVDLGPVGALPGRTLSLELLDEDEPLKLELLLGAAGSRGAQGRD